MLLFYVRHGEPVYDPDSLTPLGEKQAEALVERFSVYGLDKIYASDSNRAVLTATPTAKALGLTIEKLPWCNEALAGKDFNVNKFRPKFCWCFQDGESIKNLLSKKAVKKLDDFGRCKLLKKETFDKGIKRIDLEADKFLSSLGYFHDREKRIYYKEKVKYNRVGLFAHQGFGLAFLSSILDIPYNLFSTHFDLGHSSVTAIDFIDYGDFCIPKILQMSNDSHIFKANLPLKYNGEIDL